MGVFVFSNYKNLGHAVSRQDISDMFKKAMAPNVVKDITIDFKNGVVKGKYKSDWGNKGWKTKKIKFVEV